jgi:hypothetical protein
MCPFSWCVAWCVSLLLFVFFVPARGFLINVSPERNLHNKRTNSQEKPFDNPAHSVLFCVHKPMVNETLTPAAATGPEAGENNSKPPKRKAKPRFQVHPPFDLQMPSVRLSKEQWEKVKERMIQRRQNYSQYVRDLIEADLKEVGLL